MFYLHKILSENKYVNICIVAIWYVFLKCVWHVFQCLMGYRFKKNLISPPLSLYMYIHAVVDSAFWLSVVVVTNVQIYSPSICRTVTTTVGIVRIHKQWQHEYNGLQKLMSESRCKSSSQPSYRFIIFLFSFLCMYSGNWMSCPITKACYWS